MIRIETTAEFDAEGRFTLKGQSLVPVTPGKHRVTVVLDELGTEPEAEAIEPPFKRVGNVLVFTGELLEDPEAVRQRLDDESFRRIIEGPFE